MANLNQMRVAPTSTGRAARPRGGDAFTLVELLVVVAIIAILAALLSPALRSARDRSKQIQCMSNMRQMIVALNLYADEQGGWTPAPAEYFGPDLHPWIRPLTANGYLGGARIAWLANPPPAIELQVPRCPAWPHATWSRSTIYGLRTHTSEYTKHNLAKVSNLSEYGLVFDTITQLAGANFGQQWYRINPGAQQRIHLRHLGRTNVGFADGGVRCLSMNELMQIETGNLAQYGFGYTTSGYYYSGP